MNGAHLFLKHREGAGDQDSINKKKETYSRWAVILPLSFSVLPFSTDQGLIKNTKYVRMSYLVLLLREI